MVTDLSWTNQELCLNISPLSTRKSKSIDIFDKHNQQNSSSIGGIKFELEMHSGIRVYLVIMGKNCMVLKVLFNNVFIAYK